MPELSIIILSYNTCKLTRTCLETCVSSLQSNPKLKAEIIVIDNNSHDGSPAMLVKFARDVDALRSNISMKLHCSQSNLGFSKGNNVAAKMATGTYLLFLNSDIEVIGNAIPCLLSTYKQSPYSFAGARLLNSDSSSQPSAGRFYTLPVACAALLMLGDRWGFSRSSPHKDTFCDWVSGACLMTTKEHFNAIGGFDEDVFMYWDEIDLLFRARKNGLRTGFIAEPTFIHHEGASSKSRTQPIIKVYEGYIYFYRKHYSPFSLYILRGMLKLKALLSYMIGRATGNRYLIETYSQAYEIAQKN